MLLVLLLPMPCINSLCPRGGTVSGGILDFKVGLLFLFAFAFQLITVFLSPSFAPSLSLSFGSGKEWTGEERYGEKKKGSSERTELIVGMMKLTFTC